MTRPQSALVVAASLAALGYVALCVALSRLLDEHGDELDGVVA